MINKVLLIKFVKQVGTTKNRKIPETDWQMFLEEDVLVSYNKPVYKSMTQSAGWPQHAAKL
ncbi:MAG: hypothetical protein TE42_03865 [Candidatus Synechococcus spongiarum SP3]|uniref:Uncharacterized protein n=1 Tax=Candidatus Synechococcus spongiarum SP3 TaxID=1604020 RepID=A0A0G2J539_9SYNE|nr:MAG: hypothetical protein TE42_03865 [Candidatus Synechococcus spongiarum SP3]